MTTEITKMDASHTFDIFSGAGVRLATISLHNYGYATAQQEAQAVAKLLTGGNWAISRVEPKTEASKFIDEFVEVRS